MDIEMPFCSVSAKKEAMKNIKNWRNFWKNFYFMCKI